MAHRKSLLGIFAHLPGNTGNTPDEEETLPSTFYEEAMSTDLTGAPDEEEASTDLNMKR